MFRDRVYAECGPDNGSQPKTASNREEDLSSTTVYHANLGNCTRMQYAPKDLAPLLCELVQLRLETSCKPWMVIQDKSDLAVSRNS